MDDSFKRLLEAEARAEAIIEEASRTRERIVTEALEAAREAELRFEKSRPEIGAPFMKEAEARADQAVAELTRRSGERQRRLRDLAARHEDDAVAAAVALLLDPRH